MRPQSRKDRVPEGQVMPVGNDLSLSLEAISFCSPVITEWVRDAGVTTESVDVEFHGRITPRLVRKQVGEYLDLGWDWQILAARFGQLNDRCFRRFVVVDDSVIRDPEWGPSLRDGLLHFAGVPITVVNISRTPPDDLSERFGGVIDFEFNALQEKPADFREQLRLHLTAQRKTNEWRQMTFRRAIVYAVCTLCVLPYFAQLFANLTFAIVEPGSKWNKYYAESAMLVAAFAMFLISFAFYQWHVPPQEDFEGHLIPKPTMQVSVGRMRLGRVVFASLTIAFLTMAAAWSGVFK